MQSSFDREFARVVGEVGDRLSGRVPGDVGPGVAAALVDRSGSLAVLSFGVEDLHSERDVTPETLFQVGSMTKPVTAAALLRYTEAGHVDLARPVSHYLDWFEVPSGHVTLHQLLTHTGGLVRLIDTVPASKYATWMLRETRTSSPSGLFHYSNMGYLVLGQVLEAISGLTYHETLRLDLFDPLRMSSSVGAITNEIGSALATGHYSIGGGHAPAPTVELEGGHAGICSSAADMGRFLQMLLDGGGSFLSDDSVNAMTTPHVHSDLPGYSYGYGLFVGEMGGHRIVQHCGENLGFASCMIGDLDLDLDLDHDHGVGVVMLVNSFDSPWAEAREALRSMRRLGPRRSPPPDSQSPPGPVTRSGRSDPTPTGSGHAYAGHYRAHAPLLSDYRVISRSGQLFLESNGLFEEPMYPLGSHSFGVGGAHSPESATFGAFFDGVAQRCIVSGATYVRVGR